MSFITEVGGIVKLRFLHRRWGQSVESGRLGSAPRAAILIVLRSDTRVVPAKTSVPRVPFSGTLLHHDLVSPYITPKVGGVLHGITVCIIVEIREDIQSVGQVLVNLGSMGCEG